jgi:CBS domain-containing protein
MRCPYCTHDNVPGVDLCAECGGELAGLDIPEAQGGFTGELMTGSIGDLDLVSPLTIGPEATVAEAVELLRQQRHGCVLVTEGEELVGMFTERDLLLRVLRPRRDPSAVRVGDVMTTELFVLEPGDPPAYAIHRMVSQGFRHLPVVEGRRLLGFVSVRNILRYVHEEVIGELAPAG